PEREEGRLLELECERALDAVRGAPHLRERARHANRLERFLAEVVRLFGVEREDLECNRHVWHQQRDHGLDPELLERLQAVVAIRRQVMSIFTDGDDRIEEAADL